MTNNVLAVTASKITQTQTATAIIRTGTAAARTQLKTAGQQQTRQ